MGQGVSLSVAGASRTSANLPTLDKGDVTLNNVILIREWSMLDCEPSHPSDDKRGVSLP